ncbi:MAG: flagellar protein FliS [Actinobacteria bacterium]|nr:flagellar protein FliS [Actinomycetota bacterium]
MSTTTAAIANYSQSSAVTASPHEVVLLAYERVLTACNRAEHADRVRPPMWMQMFHNETVLAQAILVELSTGLSLDSGDQEVVDLAEKLDSLYRYAAQQLAQANVKKSSSPLAVVHMIVDGLRDAWACSEL